MQIFENSSGTVFVFERGKEVITSLTSYAKDNSLNTAWLMSGLGGSSKAVISWYDPKTREYVDQTLTEPLEIISLSGNLSMVDGEPFWHVHGTLGRRDYSTVSGHIKSLTIGLTGELLITPLETPMTRRYDDATGLKLLRQPKE